jgi:excinuclease ABC subunit A
MRQQEVIKTADGVIDLGRRAATKAARSSPKGRPGQVAGEPRSYTGSYLTPLLNGSRTETPAGSRKKVRTIRQHANASLQNDALTRL